MTPPVSKTAAPIPTKPIAKLDIKEGISSFAWINPFKAP